MRSVVTLVASARPKWARRSFCELLPPEISRNWVTALPASDAVARTLAPMAERFEEAVRELDLSSQWLPLPLLRYRKLPSECELAT